MAPGYILRDEELIKYECLRNPFRIKEEDENEFINEFISDKCDHIETIDSLNLLPLTPELPNCYMYTVIYSLSNINKFSMKKDLAFHRSLKI